MTELSSKEASEIFEIIAVLECKAIEKTTFTAKQLKELKQINKAFKNASNTASKLQLDMQFHQKLIENYSNSYLKKIIENIRTRIFIYEHHFMVTEPVETSAQMHDHIIEALKLGNKKEAIKTLNANWNLSIHNIIKTYNTSKK